MFQVKAGDIEQLGILFERYKKPLFGFFYRTTRNPALCEDLVQNVFLRLLKYRTTFTGSGKFTTWMFQIAHNVFVDNCTRSGRTRNIEDMDENSFIAEQELTDNVIKEEEVRLLNEALNKLDAEQRELIVLSKYQELKYKEIGNILNCSEGAVRVRIFRAVAELKKIYLQLEGKKA
jgi:RNA polymerase sigma factor (sigma-70 family)